MTMIFPKLQSEDVHSQALLKIDALEIITKFCYQIPRATALSLNPNLMKFLLPESIVVHFYATSWIEKMFIIKEGNQLCYDSGDIN